MQFLNPWALHIPRRVDMALKSINWWINKSIHIYLFIYLSSYLSGIFTFFYFQYRCIRTTQLMIKILHWESQVHTDPESMNQTDAFENY